MSCASGRVVAVQWGADLIQEVRHSWDLTPRQAIVLQSDLSGRIADSPLAGPVKTVGGVDCAFVHGGRQIVAAAVVMEARSCETIARAYAIAAVRFPYVPGLLSFRECPAELEAIGQLPFLPDLLLVDGAGIAHPRRLGIASHLGLWLGIPTIGVAKSRLCGRHRAVGRQRGACVQLSDGGRVIGAVLRTREGIRPLYVSVGNRITLREATKWTLRLARRFRLPEPIRAADQMAGELGRTL